MTTAAQAQGSGLRAIIGDYVALTKPRIMLLLLVTALTGLVLASRGVPSLGLTLTVLTGGALASGGASALNHWYEEDLDRKMGRTRRRPVAAGRVQPRHALYFGLALNGLAFGLLSAGTNFLAAGLAMAGTLVYFFVYTVWLKRTTPQNIVIGGAAGAIPPLVGWAAATGTVGLPAWYLFAIIFFWTPPHFWALALVIREDYARAGVPMLPVVEGDARARVQILLYSVLLAALAVLFVAAEPALGLIYGVGSVVLSAGFIYYALRLWRDGSTPNAWALYRFSLAYLATLFLLVMVDGSIN